LQGATLIFADHSKIIGKEDKSYYNGRYKIRGLKGAVIRNLDNIQYVQNGTITQTQQLLYTATNQILSGYEVDPDNDAQKGNYELEPDANVVFLASNVVNLKPGFRAKEGAAFHAYCAPVFISTECSPQETRLSGEIKSNVQNHNTSPFILYPNPSTGKFRLANSTYAEITGKIYITDAMGKLVYEKSVQSRWQIEFNLSNEPKGIYYVKIVEDDFVSTNKIVID
jgi:hypothetical protein